MLRRTVVSGWRSWAWVMGGVRGLNTATKNTTVGIVGCGNVGSAVAHNLARQGFKVVAAFDVDPARLAALPPGVPSAPSPRHVAAAADVVVTGLPRPPNVRAAAEGPDGILAGLTKDKVWIDHSTTDCDQTKEFQAAAAQQGAHVLEAPITGGLEALKKGEMVVHVGGDEEVARAMHPILKASYCEVFYVGAIGTAMMVKVVSNMLACVHVIAMGEVMLLAKRANLDLRTFWEAIRVSAGNSFVWETGGPVIFKGSYDPGFTMALQNKDLQLGYDMARKYEVPMDMHQMALAVYRRTQYQLGDDAGCYSPPKTYELAVNESLRVEDFDAWDYNTKIHDGSLIVSHTGLKHRTKK
ncbi:3-hydroxyisobutyrate dehydrogenase, mitochondrial [Chionoecetes opilio]|uniref:3-hydroxyisobutyrate dehydrogenase, mitochondrial n=1 Tax=Chionoecetes opilio TaxID=41210 RepID=A0A8J4XXZ1_CHIOP|nr:3-hydroxyisobutyrate dehydrogenase, mitochondrial [Chionoecetes opilio]